MYKYIVQLAFGSLKIISDEQHVLSFKNLIY